MVNVTAFEGQTIRIRCDVTGFPLPRYRWLLNGKPLLTDESRRYEARTTVWGSLLVYDNLWLSDSLYSAVGLFSGLFCTNNDT